jgi:ribosomal protein S18 acetylase RimI-like enzyme
MPDPAFAVREATSADIPRLAQHRVSMFRDMDELLTSGDELARAMEAYLREAMPRREYLAWIADVVGPSRRAIGGAGAQLRPIPPRPLTPAGDLELGPEAIVLNVYVEPDWRRRGVARALVRTVLSALAERGIRRIVLHASEDGRRLYESLGFVQTNEMRLIGPTHFDDWLGRSVAHDR